MALDLRLPATCAPGCPGPGRPGLSAGVAWPDTGRPAGHPSPRPGRAAAPGGDRRDDVHEPAGLLLAPVDPLAVSLSLAAGSTQPGSDDPGDRPRPGHPAHLPGQSAGRPAVRSGNFSLR